MGRDEVLAGFRAEAESLTGAMLGLAEPDFATLTPCEPWTVDELLTHVVTATSRVPAFLAEPEPDSVDVDAAGYYRPAIFDAKANADRVAGAQRDTAGYPTGRAIVEDFDATWRRAYEMARAERDDRRTLTRWGDGMLLTDFLTTRVVELALHGMDLATALNRKPWLTPEAAVVVERLLLAGNSPEAAEGTGWDRTTFIAKASGRSPLTEAESAQVAELGVTWITFG